MNGGNGDALIYFIKRIDLMVPIFESFPAEYKVLLMDSIKDKITDSARRFLLMNGILDTSPLIERVLIDFHCKKSSVKELID